MFSARLTDPHCRRGKRAFDAVVVDEAQDVGIPELRFLAIAGPWCADGPFLTGDLGPRIFKQPFSWKSLGVDIRGRSYTLRLRQAARIAEIIIVKDCHGRGGVRVHWGAAVGLGIDASPSVPESATHRQNDHNGSRNARPCHNHFVITSV
jgi:hypothetical protein